MPRHKPCGYTQRTWTPHVGRQLPAGNCVISSPDASAASSCCHPAALRALPAPELSALCARESPTAVPADTMGALVARTPAGGSCVWLRECRRIHGSNSRPCTTKCLRACCALQLVDEWQAQSCGGSKACPALHRLTGA